MFFVLLATLIIFLSAFIAFLLFIRKMSSETFVKLCQGKVKRFAKRKNLLAISDLSITNYKNEKLLINHVIFGKKYIYLIGDFLLKGFVKGDAKDNSWIYYNNIRKKDNYLDNLLTISSKNMQDFAEILQISADPIVFICLVPNECDFDIKNMKNDKQIIARYSRVISKINSLEKENIGTLNQEQIYEQFKTIESRNKESKQRQ